MIEIERSESDPPPGGVEGAARDAAVRHLTGRASLELPHHGVWICDRDERTVFANQTLLDMLGTRDVVGRSTLEFFAESERARIEERSARRAFGVAEEYETRLETADGFVLPVLVSASPRFDRDGHYLGTVAVVRDLRQQNASREAGRLGLDRLLAEEARLSTEIPPSLAHALNTSLQAVLGLAEVLREDERLPEALEPTAAQLRAAARTCRELVSRIVSLARHDEEEPRAVDLVHAVEDAVGAREAYLAANNVAVVRSYASGGTVLHVDAGRLGRLLSHVVENACELALAGGGGSIEVRVEAAPDHLGLTVRIPGREHPPDVLEPGVSEPGVLAGDAARSGAASSPMSVGFSVAAAVAGDLGGELYAENTREGASIVLVLPGPVPREEAGAAPGSRPSPRPSVDPRPEGRADILVVDDEPIVLELNRRALASMGEVVLAETADEALSLLADRHFDLVLTDLRMPGALDGMGLFHWLEAHRPELASRVVFTTADTLAPRARDFLAACGRPHLKKPYNIRDLQAVVLQVLQS